ncbi:MAG: hypothetical protein JWM58_3531 [Rhizobium sp.]|nr:hypothetical protein [Rhizobium sp.]
MLACAGFGMVMLFIQQCSGGSAAISGPGGFYPAPEQESASITLVRDKEDRLHMAHTGYDGKTKDFIYYGVCDSSDCGTSKGNWQIATIPFARANKIQLAVTSDGKPRLYVTSYAAPNKSSYNRTYSYGECDDDCQDAANWKFAEIADSGDNLLSEVLNLRVPDRTFALDAQGRPRFIYTDANYGIEPDHYGAFVMSCDADCLERANWKETDLALHITESYRHEQFTKPVLSIAENGTMGVLANVYAFDDSGKALKNGLYYYGCADDCTSKANWKRAFVHETGGGSYPNPTWDLAFTRDGQPRIAQFAGNGLQRQDLDHQLIYFWCKADCGDGKSWNGSTVQPGEGIGESADLVLDAEDRPRIGMLTTDGQIALAACNDDCETDKPAWKSELVEAMSVPEKERPQAMPLHCDGEIWNGQMPSLALNEKSATIAYDIVVSARCLYKDYQDPIPSYTFHELFHGTRVANFPFK